VNKTLKQLREERQVSLDEMTALINVAEAEDRNLTEDEQKAFDATEKNVNDLASRIDRLERSLELAKNNTPVSFSTQDVKETDKDLRKFSFGAAAKAAYTGVVEGIVKEMDQEARNEAPNAMYRGIAIPSAVLESRALNTAANAKGIEVASFIDELQANSVLASAGANFYTGLQADRRFPIVGSCTASFVSESGYTSGTTEAAESGAITKKDLSPKKIISLASMSAELMEQNPAVEAALQRNLATAVMAQFEANLLAAADQTSTTGAQGPDSIFKAVLDAATGTTGATAMAIEDVLNCEANVLANDVNPSAARMAYIFNASGLGAAKGLASNNYVDGYMDNFQKTINTYPFKVSSNLGKAANGSAGAGDYVLFGDMSDIHLGQFGGMSILYDPYTTASRGIGRLVITNLLDGLVARPDKAFSFFVDTDS
tara:strand:+ start:591 stop:1877 length:1287 start_codon:yes stop_codon:yes gene_type:complete